MSGTTGEGQGQGQARSAGVALTPDDRAACAVAADWLATARVSAALAFAGTAVAVAGLATGGVPHALALLVPLAIAERVLAVRVAFDARLFARLADGSLDLAGLDAGLQRVLDVPAARAGRPMAPRLAGARRLYRWHAGCAAGLLLVALVTWMT